MKTIKPKMSTPSKSTNTKIEPLSLELFNHAAVDLNQNVKLSKKSTRNICLTETNGSHFRIHY